MPRRDRKLGDAVVQLTFRRREFLALGQRVDDEVAAHLAFGHRAEPLRELFTLGFRHLVRLDVRTGPSG